MAFELVVPGALGFKLPEDVVTLDKNGQLYVPAKLLARLLIEDRVAVLVDTQKGLLALRQPRWLEGREREASVSLYRASPTQSARLTVRGALTRLGKQAAACAGRYRVMVKDDLCVVALDGPQWKREEGG